MLPLTGCYGSCFHKIGTPAGLHSLGARVVEPLQAKWRLQSRSIHHAWKRINMAVAQKMYQHGPWVVETKTKTCLNLRYVSNVEPNPYNMESGEPGLEVFDDKPCKAKREARAEPKQREMGWQ